MFTEAMQPLGLLYVASVLREADPSRRVALVDLRTRKHQDPANLRPDLERLRPQIVGISACSCEHREVHEASRAIKEAVPDATVIVGGPYATAAPRLVLEDPHVDIVVRGEGEETARELLDALPLPAWDLLDLARPTPTCLGWSSSTPIAGTWRCSRREGAPTDASSAIGSSAGDSVLVPPRTCSVSSVSSTRGSVSESSTSSTTSSTSTGRG